MNILTPSHKRKSLIFWGFPFLIAYTITNCAIEPVPPCPSIRIDTNTSKLIRYKNDGPIAPDNIMHTAEILSYEGNCNFKGKGVEVKFDVELLIKQGPRSETRALELFYFVAIPQFFPDPNGKTIFVREHQITDRTPKSEVIKEKNIKVFLPLENRLKAAAYDIYVGFQLTKQELQENRAQK